MTMLVPRQWRSKSALQAHLAASRGRSLLLGEEAEAPRMYYSFSAHQRDVNAEIGLISSGLGAEPAAALWEEERRVLVGHDTWVSSVNLVTLAATSSLRLSGVFYEFIPIAREDAVVVLHEIGAVCLNEAAVVKWSIQTDIVEGWTINGKDELILAVLDGPPVVVSLTTGGVSTRA